MGRFAKFDTGDIRGCMSSDDIEPFDRSRRFFGRKGFFDDMFRGFDEMRREFDKQRLQLHQVLVGRKVTSRQNVGFLSFISNEKSQRA